MGHITRFTPAEDAVIIANNELPQPQIAKLVTAVGVANRTALAIQSRRRVLGLVGEKGEWTDEETERLRKLWVDEQLTAAEIARLWPERTRNSINKKAERMKWPRVARQSCTVTTKVALAPLKTAKRVSARWPTVEADPLPEAKAAPVAASMNLRMWDDAFGAGCCKYATEEDDVGYFFCAAPVEPGLPYCKPHAGVCYNGFGAQPPKAPSAKADHAERRIVADDDGEPRPLDFGRAA